MHFSKKIKEVPEETIFETQHMGHLPERVIKHLFRELESVMPEDTTMLHVELKVTAFVKV